MRLILVLTVLFCQFNLIAQAIIGKFDAMVSEDDFSTLSGKWEQRNSLTDFYITEDGLYIVKNKSSEFFSTSLHLPDLNLSKYEVSALLKSEGSKKQELSIGLMVNAQMDGSGAVVCEINGKGQYRIRKILNYHWEVLSYSIDGGWIKHNAIRSNAFNEITLRCDNGTFDLWINSEFLFSFYAKNINSGNIGILINPKSSGMVDNIRIMQESMPILPPALTQANFDSIASSASPKTVLTENEVVLLLKGKIDKQQKKINTLLKDLERCNRQKSGDTSLELKHAELIKYNELLLIDKGKTEIELRNANEILAEYELLKKSLENDTNGDIILSLTELLNREKLKNLDLSKKIKDLKAENQKLSTDLQTLKK